MHDILQTIALALILGVLLRILRELQLRREERCGDDDEVWPMEQLGERDDERTN